MPDPDLTPEQEQEVRRLLADARHTEPMPTDVAARLDRVLADLGSQPGAARLDDQTAVASVTDLASRRRQRVVRVLVAAAAVVAVGAGVNQVINHASSGNGGASATSAAEDAATSRQPHRSGGKGANQDRVMTNGQHALAEVTPVRVRPRHFSADAARAERALDSPRETNDVRGQEYGFRSCATDDWGAGTYVPVRYDGHAAVLVFRPANGDSRVVDLFGCGGSDPLRSITLPAR